MSLITDQIMIITQYITQLSFSIFGNSNKLNHLTHPIIGCYRLTPVYAFLLVFYMGFMMLMYDGPWSRVGEHAPAVTSCFEYWWANLLYLNNFIPGGMADQVCLIERIWIL